MVDPTYSDDEQAERLKEWWKKNGTSIVVGGVLGISAIIGVNLWRDYVKTQAENASELFTQLLVSQGEPSQQLGEELISDYEQTPYAALAALYMARTYYQDGDTENAETMLKWAMDNGKQTAIRHAARLRLARVYLEKGAVDDVERLIETDQYDGFESEYKELLGDLAMLKGDAEGARSAYEDALSKLSRGSRFSELLALKLDNAIGESTK